VIHTLGGYCMISDSGADPEQGKRIVKLLMDGLRYGAPVSA